MANYADLAGMIKIEFNSKRNQIVVEKSISIIN